MSPPRGGVSFQLFSSFYRRKQLPGKPESTSASPAGHPMGGEGWKPKVPRGHCAHRRLMMFT